MSSFRLSRGRSLAAVAAAAALLLTACGEEEAATPAAEGASGIELVNEGQLTVCTHLPYEPFEFSEGDETVGFDIDLMDLVAEELGAERTVINTPFEGIQSGEDLNARKCDIAAAGMTITAPRQEAIAFSDPYFDATQALIVPADSTATSLEDLDGQTLGVQAGTTGKLYAEENAPEGVTLRTYEDLALLLTAVKTGQIDAAINDNGVLYDYVQDNPDLEVVTEFDTGEQYGFGLRKEGSEELLETVNTVLEEAMSDGTYDEIYETWFGTVPQSAS